MGTEALETCLSRVQPGTGWVALALAGDTFSRSENLAAVQKDELPLCHSSSTPLCGILPRSHDKPSNTPGLVVPRETQLVKHFIAAPPKASLKELRESVKVVCKGPIYFHRSHTMELTFQLTASGLSEEGTGGGDLDMQGWRMQEEVEHHSRKWLDQHILQGTG